MESPLAKEDVVSSDEIDLMDYDEQQPQDVVSPKREENKEMDMERSRLYKLDYSELRKTAKAFNIKANLKKEKMVKEVLFKQFPKLFAEKRVLPSESTERPMASRRFTVATGSNSPALFKKENYSKNRFFAENQNQTLQTGDFLDDNSSLKRKTAINQEGDSIEDEGDHNHSQDNNNSADNEMSEANQTTVNDKVSNEIKTTTTTKEDEGLENFAVPEEQIQTISRRAKLRARSSQFSLNETFSTENSELSDKEDEDSAESVSSENIDKWRKERILAEINRKMREAGQKIADVTVEHKSPQECLTDAIASPKSGTAAKSGRYGKAHEKLFSQMDDIRTHTDKKETRARQLSKAASSRIKELATPKRERQASSKAAAVAALKRTPGAQFVPGGPKLARQHDDEGYDFSLAVSSPKVENFAFPVNSSTVKKTATKTKEGQSKTVSNIVTRSRLASTVSNSLRETKSSAAKQKQALTKTAAIGKKVAPAKVPNQKTAETSRRGNYVPYKGRLPTYVDTTNLTDTQVEQRKKLLSMQVKNAKNRAVNRIEIEKKQKMGREAKINAQRNN